MLEIVGRAAHLLALTLVPQALSPEPLPPPKIVAALEGAGIVAGLLLVTHFARWAETTRAKVGAAMVWASVAAALVLASIYSGDDAPLGRGVPFLAPLLWPALAVVASALGESSLGSNWKHRRMAPVVVVLCAGALVLARAGPLLGSREAMWKAALKAEPRHPDARHALARLALARGAGDEARRHARRFRDAFPEDPRGPELARDTGLTE